jgi:actin-related protein
VQEDGGGASGATAPQRSIHVSQSARILRPDAQTRSPYDLCLVEDFDILDALWHEGFKSLRADVRSSPVMIIEPPYAPPSQRERTAELLFEGHGVPFLYLARAPVCQAFSVGRTSAIVVDIGASATRVTPVVDGYALNKGQLVSEVGGSVISAAMHEALLRSGQLGPNGVVPRALVRKTPRAGSEKNKLLWDVSTADSSTLSRSMLETLKLEAVDDVKKAIAHVAEVGHNPALPPADKTYELPDGTPLTIGSMREFVCELHFRQEAVDAFRGIVMSRHNTGWSLLQGLDILGKRSASQPYPLHHMIHQSLLACQPVLRRDLAHHS